MFASCLLVPFLLGFSSTGEGGKDLDAERLPALWIHGERIILRPGVELEDAAILIEKGIIVAIGPDVQAPEGARKIEGKTICAGFIDPWSSLGLDPGSVQDQRTQPSTHTIDSLDTFGMPELRQQALEAGVTSLRLQAGQAAQQNGLGILVRTNAGPDSEVLLQDACLSITLSSVAGRRADVFSRAASLSRVVGSIKEGEAYRLEQVEYRHELAEWQKGIDEATEKLTDDFKKAKKKRDKDKKSAEEKGKEFKDKKYKEDKPPREPKQDADRAVMARVAEGELPVVFEARDPAEIRSLLRETADIERLRMLISGAEGAEAFAEELAKRKIPVLLWPSTEAPGPAGRADKDLTLAGKLERMGVPVLIGSGGQTSSRDLRLLAAMAISHGLSPEAALNAITLGPAKAFDVSDRVGSLKRGLDADILIFDGDPLDTTSKIQFVISRGRVVAE